MSARPVIHTIDLQYLDQPQTIASYLVLGGDGPVLVETGPGSTVGHLVAGLRQHGLEPKDIRHALVSHIHLDHAGAAGWLARQGAMIHVHEFGAGHLLDPTRLIASATRIYGDQMQRLWGEVLPVPEERVNAVRDGDVLEFGDVRFTVIETPGHARHHHAYCLQLEVGSVCFTGDAAAMIVPGTKFIALPTPPPEFDLEAWLRSLRRLDDRRFKSLFLTHFGEIRTPTQHLAAVRRAVRSHAEFVRSGMRLGLNESAILNRYRPWVHRQALAADVLEDQLPHFVSENLLKMNVTGLVRYWKGRTAAGG